MTCKHLAVIVAVGKDWKYLRYKRLTFSVSKNLSFLLPRVLHCILKLPLKGSSHDMTSSFFDCLEISTCVCVPSLRHTSLFRPSQYDSHLHINSLVRIHRFFFRLWAQNFHFNFHHMIAVAYVLPSLPYISHHANEMEYHSSAADGQG